MVISLCSSRFLIFVPVSLKLMPLHVFCCLLVLNILKYSEEVRRSVDLVDTCCCCQQNSEVKVEIYFSSHWSRGAGNPNPVKSPVEIWNPLWKTAGCGTKKNWWTCSGICHVSATAVLCNIVTLEILSKSWGATASAVAKTWQKGVTDTEIDNEMRSWLERQDWNG